MNAGASVCNTHNTYDINDVLGVVVKGSARIASNQAVCKIRLSEREEVAGIVNDIKSGIIRNVSVGYAVNSYDIEDAESDTPTAKITSWTPYEISFVPVPADHNSTTNRAKPNNNNNNTENNNNNNMNVKEQINEAVQADRKRSLEITRRCRAANIPIGKEEELLASNRTMDQISSDIIDYYEAVNLQEAQRAKTSVTATHNHTKQILKKAIDDVTKRKKSILTVARDILPANREYTSAELVRAAMTTSDFPQLLHNIANKTLQDAYQIAPQTFRPLAREVTLPNFKKHLAARMGDAPELKRKLEGGEYEQAAIGEEGETYNLATYGRIVALTREAIINDDLGGFTQAISNFGTSANIRESDLFYDAFLANQKMSDGKAYFSAEHENLLKVAAPKLSIDNLAKARKMLTMQKTIDKRFMNLEMKYLVVSPSMYTEAQQFLSTNLFAATVSDINPFIGSLQIITDPRLDVAPTEWYIACNNSSTNLFNIAYLDTNRGAYISEKEDFETDTTKYKCRLDCAVAPIDWRGIVKVAK